MKIVFLVEKEQGPSEPIRFAECPTELPDDAFGELKPTKLTREILRRAFLPRLGILFDAGARNTFITKWEGYAPAEEKGEGK